MHIQAQSAADVLFPIKVAAMTLALSQSVTAVRVPDREPSLGGRLVYAGALDGDGRALLAAANIAGAASLAATADPAAQRLAIRDGIADFCVNSLDEALRILKNEIRKREPVAVCVACDAETVQWQMVERGVLPDLLRSGEPFAAHSPFLAQGARQIQAMVGGETSALVVWSVESAPARWLPVLDEIAMQCLAEEYSDSAWIERRWLRQAPRYLGRLMQGVHLIRRDRAFAARFIERARERVDGGLIGVPVEIQVIERGLSDSYRLVPPESASGAV